MNQEHVSQIALYFRDLQHEMVIQADVQRALTEALQQLTSEFNQFRHIANIKLEAISNTQLGEIAELKEELARIIEVRG
tara:strand:- start:13138 stop:13374 length:237 start_codon:yes stop_codon:yes gene_type:complete